MKAQLLIESLFALALEISFVVFVLLVFAGMYGYYQSSGAAMDRMYNASALSAHGHIQARMPVM